MLCCGADGSVAATVSRLERLPRKVYAIYDGFVTVQTKTVVQEFAEYTDAFSGVIS